MLNIKDITMYDEDTQQAIKEFIEGPLSSSHSQEKKETLTNLIEAVDKYLFLLKKEEKSLDRSFGMCGVSLMRLMLEDACSKYADELPDMIRDVLKQIMNKIDNM